MAGGPSSASPSPALSEMVRNHLSTVGLASPAPPPILLQTSDEAFPPLPRQ